MTRETLLPEGWVNSLPGPTAMLTGCGDSARNRSETGGIWHLPGTEPHLRLPASGLLQHAELGQLDAAGGRDGNKETTHSPDLARIHGGPHVQDSRQLVGAVPKPVSQLLVSGRQ